jgi:hypothetical protein
MPDTRPLEVTVGHPAREEESLSLSLSLSFHLLGKFVLTRTNGDRMKSSPWSEAEVSASSYGGVGKVQGSPPACSSWETGFRDCRGRIDEEQCARGGALEPRDPHENATASGCGG